MATFRDKTWMFGVRPHQDDIYLGKRDEDRFTKWSRITPAEGAAMLGVPNMLMINCDGIPVPFSHDAYGYMESFRRMKNVLWSSTGSAGMRIGNEERFIAELAAKYPNLTGAFMDDFFGAFCSLPEPERSQKALALLQEIQRGLDTAPRPMELWVVSYTQQLALFHPDVYEPLTGITFWTWNCDELPLLEERFEALERILPGKKKMLGVYMYDFPSGRPVPLELMEHQCELARRLVHEGRIDGVIFEANSVMGVGLPSERWLCDWLDRVGDEEL